MKAVLQTRYGPPDVLQLKDVERPVPNDGEVLVEVRGASANPLDWHGMRGEPFLARLAGGLRNPKDPRMGADIAGRVEALGKGVTMFNPGDEVFGIGVGGFAEYAPAREGRLALKPTNCSFEEAAAVPVAGITALQGLRDRGQIKPGQKVLVNGASGGVGTFAVQIAKNFGAEVTGVCSSRNLDLVRSIGADHVVDYTKEDFTRDGQRYDLIYDAVGNRSVSDYKRALRPDGICVIVGFTSLRRVFGHAVLGPLMSKAGNKKAGFMGIPRVTHEDLVVLKELIEGGRVKPVIDRRYPLGETGEALRYLEGGHARRKMLITFDQGQ